MEHCNGFKYTAYVDGGCPENGRPQAVLMFGSYIIYNSNEEVVEKNLEFDVHHPKKCTNNIAEAKSLEALLIRVKNKKLWPIDVFMDSKLIVNQFNGLHRMKDIYIRGILTKLPNVKIMTLSWISGDRMKEVLGH